MQQDVLAEARALDGAGDREHLAHARAALGALVADHDDVVRLQRAVLDGLHRAGLAVEHPGVALEHVGVEARGLHDRALGGERAVRIARPPVVWIGSDRARRILPSGSGGAISARFSAIVLPVTVRQSPSAARRRAAPS